MSILLGPLTMLLFGVAIAYFVIKFIKRNSKTWEVEAKNDDIIATKRAHKNAMFDDKKVADANKEELNSFMKQ
jgi:hypothetical protein